ncbi:MAG: phosphate uptake regulator PhoU [Candidatus Methanomethylicia archaeon]
MFNRRIQKIGRSSYFISLPKKWVEQFNLDKGNIIKLSIGRNGSLIIEPSNEAKEENIATIHLTSTISRDIISKYLLGYKTIKIVSNRGLTEDEVKTIKDTVRFLIGLEVVEEGLNEITIQSMLDVESIHPSKLISREGIIAEGILRDAITSLVKKDINTALLASRRDEEINRFYFLLVRVLRSALQNYNIISKFNLTPLDIVDYRLAASYIESIGDCATNIARCSIEIINNNTIEEAKLSKIVDIGNKIVGFYRKSITAFLGKDYKTANDIILTVKRFHEEIGSEMKNVNGRLFNIISNLDRIAMFIIDIADLVLIP